MDRELCPTGSPAEKQVLSRRSAVSGRRATYPHGNLIWADPAGDAHPNIAAAPVVDLHPPFPERKLPRLRFFVSVLTDQVNPHVVGIFLHDRPMGFTQRVHPPRSDIIDENRRIGCELAVVSESGRQSHRERGRARLRKRSSAAAGFVRIAPDIDGLGGKQLTAQDFFSARP